MVLSKSHDSFGGRSKISDQRKRLLRSGGGGGERSQQRYIKPTYTERAEGGCDAWAEIWGSGEFCEVVWRCR